MLFRYLKAIPWFPVWIPKAINKIPTFIMINFSQCGWYLRGGAEASNGTCICKQKPAAVFGSNPWNLETGIWRGWIIMGVGAFEWGWRRGPGRQLSRLEALTLNCISLVCACRGKKQIADRTYKCTVRKYFWKVFQDSRRALIQV